MSVPFRGLTASSARKLRVGRAFAAMAVLAGGLVAAGAASQPALASAPAPAMASTSYSWQNVQIGGGGFVDGVVFNQTQPNLVYARTDIGGMYRWNQSAQSWKPLLDWVGFNNWGYNGVVSMASDAVQPNRVYAAVGMYTNSWDPNNGAILRSTDKGDTWSVTRLPFKLGGNMPGRGMGERLAIDPNDDRILYFGAPSGQGLWRSTNYGATWSKVKSFTDAGTYVADPTDASGYQSDIQGVVWVAFDNSSARPHRTTNDIYVGVADVNNPVWRSTDGGATWAPVPGTPTGYLPHKGVFDQVNHLLYIATSNTGGPYDGSAGDVWKLDTVTGTWTRITPPADSLNPSYGFSGLTIDREHPGTIMVATQIDWWPDTIIFRSTDGGQTWTRAWDEDLTNSQTAPQGMSLHYNLDASSEPWLTFGGPAGWFAPSPKLGWMDEAMEIDPFNSNRMLYGTGATLYATNDLTNWDNAKNIDIAPMVKGLEETAVNDLISPPAGAPLLSALGDIEGFRHTDLSTVPGMMFTNPRGSGTSLDFAELKPNVIVRAGNEGSIDAAFSTDDGVTWSPAGSEPAGVTGGGVIAESADASATVWSPAGAPVSYSVDAGQTWSSSAGLPAGATVASDRADGKTFYAFSAGTFYRSTDSGATFTSTGAKGLPTTGNVHFKALPGVKGDIWLAGGTTDADNTYGLWHSTDGGVTFTRLRNVDQADNIGFGKAAPGASYPALYTIAQIHGVRGIFRSDNAGRSWVRINDDQHQYGNIGGAITGDPRVYGRVYVGTNGRGIVYGDICTSQRGHWWGWPQPGGSKVCPSTTQ